MIVTQAAARPELATPAVRRGWSDPSYLSSSPHAGKFDPAIARACVAASKAAYDSFTIQTELAHCLIIETPDYIIVACRGTKDIRDFITDAEFFRYLWFAGSVHSGFKLGAMSIFDGVVSRLSSLDSRPIYFTGHSYGAALATLLAHRLPAGIAGVYTFGSPRVGDAAFVRSYNAMLGDRTFRFVNGLDIVPRIPGLLFGYRPVRGLEFLPTAGLPLIAHPKLWMMAASDLFGAWCDLRIRHQLSLLDDHHVDRYFAKINSLPGTDGMMPSLNSPIQ